MRRTYRVPFSRAGLVGLMAALVLLCLPGTSIAGGASDTSSAPRPGSGLLQYGAGYGKADGTPRRCARSAHAAEAGLAARPGGRVVRAADRGRRHPLPISRGGRGRRDRRSADAAGTDAREEASRSGGEPASHSPNGSPQGACAPGQVAAARGLRPGPVDGLFGPRTQAAVERLQRSGGIPVSGVATERTGSCWPTPARRRTSLPPTRRTSRPSPTPGRRPPAAPRPHASRPTPAGRRTAATPPARPRRTRSSGATRMTCRCRSSS